VSLLRLTASATLKQKRLEALLAGRSEDADARLGASVGDAQALGSLELAGCAVTWADFQALRRGAPAAPEAAAFVRAQAAVDFQTPLSSAALRCWHHALVGADLGWRRQPATCARGPASAPPEFIGTRVARLMEWLDTDSGRALSASQIGALVLARLVEIGPFEQANGRVARLAAAHVMVRAGARPPILVAADRARLEAALSAAFDLNTEPLARLLEEASERALDVLIQSLTGRAG
jgi:hypothetical protein